MRASFPLTAERGRIRAVVAALCAVAAWSLSQSWRRRRRTPRLPLDAASGSAVKGEGSSLQKEAQTEFWTTHVFYTGRWNGCGASALVSHIQPGRQRMRYRFDRRRARRQSHLLGFRKLRRRKWLSRPLTTRFAASDAPLTLAQKAAAEATVRQKPVSIHQIPVASCGGDGDRALPRRMQAQGSWNGSRCNQARERSTATTSTGGVQTIRPAPAPVTPLPTKRLRVHITADEMEKIWDGERSRRGAISSPKPTSKGTIH